MSPRKIEEAFEKFVKRKRVENIHYELVRRGRWMMNMYRFSNDILILWVLTYLLDEEDYLFDSIGYFGLVDDFLVLDFAEQMLKD